jgi:carbamoylphosphate synthase small subunit
MWRWPTTRRASSTSRRWSPPRAPFRAGGLDLAKDVTCAQSYRWDEMRWAWPEGYPAGPRPRHKVVAVDYGAKRNILRCLASAGCDVTVLPATATADEVWRRTPTACSCPTAPAIRRRPAPTPCR